MEASSLVNALQIAVVRERRELVYKKVVKILQQNKINPGRPKILEQSERWIRDERTAKRNK